MTLNTPEPAGEINSHIQKKQTEETQNLAVLLDNQLSKRNQILVQKTQMGNTEAYIGSVSLEWLESRVRFASQLPLFRQKYDPTTDNIIRDEETADDLFQRPLDWSRQASLAQYLIGRKNHKFPAVLVVQNPLWVDDMTAPQWDENERATQSATNFISLDKDNTIGLLDISDDITIYALDGQHRLMGIQGLMTLIKTGKLQPYNKFRKPIGSPLTTDQLLEKYQLTYNQLQNLAKEKIGIEFIPAVTKGETREEATRRIRSIFVHVNLMAVNLSQGQLALLNEDDGFSIIARKIAVSHPLFKAKKDRNARVNWDSATVAAKSTVLTTLQALKEMSERYLNHKFPHWKPIDKKGLIPLRPDNEELEEGIKEFNILFDNLSELFSYQKLEEGNETPQMRRFSFEKDGGEGNILFRPIGQVALAQALGILIFKKHHSPNEVFKKLRRFDIDGGFSNMEFPQSLWYGVLYDPNKKRILVSGKELATKLLIYILGGIQDDLERAELRLELAEARTIEDKAINFEGKFVQPKTVGLPPILS
ncbi:MAG TPA: DGQHR domain-containing protein [Halomicronema sp.]